MNDHRQTPITSISISQFDIPTDLPESDGTFEWNATTMIVVIIEAEGKKGLGYTYGHPAIFSVIKRTLAPLLKNSNLWNHNQIFMRLVKSVRNDGSGGIVSHAISAVDIALWDLKAKLLGIPLCQLWGMAQPKIRAYGSGGFTSYTNEQTASQFEAWQQKGISLFKMKVGRFPDQDLDRVKNAKKVIGEKSNLFVDANGAYTRKQALDFAEKFKELGVVWFEEPVSSDDIEGLHLLRNRAPAGMDIAAGEYGYNSFYFNHMLAHQAIDVLQIDATRCCGFTGFFQAANTSQSFQIPLSCHTAPSIHLHAAIARPDVCHIEFFHDHSRIEEIFFEGFPLLKEGFLNPFLDRYGHGLEIKSHANQYLKKEITL